MQSSPSRLDPRKLAVGQGVVYILSGAWPILHIRSFEKVTGPKVDRWLVKTVGGLITVTGAVLLGAGLRRSGVSKEAALIGAGQAAVLGAVSLIYSSRGRIPKVYLWDVALESAIITGWASALLSRRPGGFSKPVRLKEISEAPRSTQTSAL